MRSQSGCTSWIHIANYPNTILDNTADEYQGLVYSVGGWDGTLASNAAYVYNPERNTWSPIARMNSARQKPAAAFVDGLLYVVGGWDEYGNPDALLEIYDPASGTWPGPAPVPKAYAAATGVGLDGVLYVIGGCDAYICGSSDVYRYNPATNTWSSLCYLPRVHLLERLCCHRWADLLHRWKRPPFSVILDALTFMIQP